MGIILYHNGIDSDIDLDTNSYKCLLGSSNLNCILHKSFYLFSWTKFINTAEWPSCWQRKRHIFSHLVCCQGYVLFWSYSWRYVHLLYRCQKNVFFHQGCHWRRYELFCSHCCCRRRIILHRWQRWLCQLIAVDQDRLNWPVTAHMSMAKALESPVTNPAPS